MVTDCDNVPVSLLGVPPNHAQTEPVRGPADPPPFPQAAIVHNGDPKLVDDCAQYKVDPNDASKLGSCIGLAIAKGTFWFVTGFEFKDIRANTELTGCKNSPTNKIVTKLRSQ